MCHKTAKGENSLHGCGRLRELHHLVGLGHLLQMGRFQEPRQLIVGEDLDGAASVALCDALGELSSGELLPVAVVDSVEAVELPDEDHEGLSVLLPVEDIVSHDPFGSLDVHAPNEGLCVREGVVGAVVHGEEDSIGHVKKFTKGVLLKIHRMPVRCGILEVSGGIADQCCDGLLVGLGREGDDDFRVSRFAGRSQTGEGDVLFVLGELEGVSVIGSQEFWFVPSEPRFDGVFDSLHPDGFLEFGVSGEVPFFCFLESSFVEGDGDEGFVVGHVEESGAYCFDGETF